MEQKPAQQPQPPDDASPAFPEPPAPLQMAIMPLETGSLRLQFTRPITFVDFDRNTALEMARQIRQTAVRLPIPIGQSGLILLPPGVSRAHNGHEED